MTFDPFNQVAEEIDETVDTAEAIEAKRERREQAKYYYCDVSRVFNNQRELRSFLESSGELPDSMTIVKGSVINPVKKVVYSI